MHNTLFILSFVLFAFGSCLSGGESSGQSESEEEALGAAMLAEARQQLKAGQWEQARQTIIDMRAQHPMALQARREAILTMDSIERLAALDSMTIIEGAQWQKMSVKAKFYERKLKHDQAR